MCSAGSLEGASAKSSRPSLLRFLGRHESRIGHESPRRRLQKPFQPLPRCARALGECVRNRGCASFFRPFFFSIFSKPRPGRGGEPKGGGPEGWKPARWVRGGRREGAKGSGWRPQFRSFFPLSRPSFCFIFSNVRSLSWNCGGLCAFSSVKMCSQHTNLEFSGLLVKPQPPA